MTTFPTAHPLANGLTMVCRFCEKRAFRGCKRHLSTLCKPMNEFKFSPEIIESTTTPSGSRTPISIALKKTDAIREEKAASETLRVYSDGSVVGGGVGGAAVLMRGETMIKDKRFYLGGHEEHTSLEAEIVGMVLAVQLLKEAGGRGTMALGVDNQAAIRSTGALHSQPGHYLPVVNVILHNALRELLPVKDGRQLIIRWTPGHKGIAGNEAADIQAKRAARGEASAGNMLPKSLRTRTNIPIKLPFSKSVTKQHFQNPRSVKKRSSTNHVRFPALPHVPNDRPIHSIRTFCRAPHQRTINKNTKIERNPRQSEKSDREVVASAAGRLSSEIQTLILSQFKPKPDCCSGCV